MNSNWQLKRISDVAHFCNHKRIPLSSMAREKRQGKYPYYGASGIVDYIDDYIFDGTYLLISEDGENLRTRKTPIASKAKGKFWVNNHAHILAEKQNGILDYLEYYFSALDLTPYITGAVQPKLNKANIATVEIPIPPDSTRLAINRVLNCLTDKIHLNTQINQTLEQIAQAIFKSWFVDFDPVKAKMAVLQSGGTQEEAERAAMGAISGKDGTALEAFKKENPEGYAELEETAALFPAGMVESELGFTSTGLSTRIPEGWGVGNIENSLTLVYGKALKKTARVNGDYPVYGSGGINGYHNEAFVAGPGIIVGRKGTVGSVYWEDAGFFPIDTVFYVEPKGDAPLSYLFYLLRTLGLEKMNTDAAVPGLNRNNAYRLEVVVPDISILQQFAKVAGLLRNSIRSNCNENKSLEQIRDTLLPQLLSGKIEMKKSDGVAS